MLQTWMEYRQPQYMPTMYMRMGSAGAVTFTPFSRWLPHWPDSLGHLWLPIQSAY